MRVSKRILGSAIAIAALTTACGPGYYSTTRVGVSAQLGSGVDLYDYSPTTYGDWRTGYRNWQTATVYEYDGHYYPNKLRGARQVQVYRSQNGYFLPPRDQEWARTDRRFDSKKIPNETDYGRARRRP